MGNRWGGKPQRIWSSGDKSHLMAKETKSSVFLSRATPTMQPLRGAAARERGSQNLEVAVPYPPSPPPLRRTPAPYPLSVAAPLRRCSAASSRTEPGLPAPRQRLGSEPSPGPPPPWGAPGPARPAAAVSQGRFGLRSRHSRGEAGGQVKKAAEGPAGLGAPCGAPRLGSSPHSCPPVEAICPQTRLHP